MIKIRPDVIKIKDPGSGNYTPLLAIKGEKGDRGENGNVFAYPVGAIYMSVDPTSPSALFGGNWEALEGRFLIGADKIYSAGAMGGSAAHTHASGGLFALISTAGANSAIRFQVKTVAGHYRNRGILVPDGVKDEAESFFSDATDVRGTTAEASNMPPYLAVYMWKRLSDETEAKEE